MWQEIVEAFTTMQWYIILPLCLGVILLVIECFVPGFGFFGISGIVCLVGAIIANAVLTKSIAQTLFLIALLFVFIFLLILIFIRSARFGLISKTPFVEKKTAVPRDYADKSKDKNRSLVGQRGVAVTPFTPSGKFMIDDKIYEGMTRGEPLDKNDVVKVSDVEGNKIVIEKVEV